MGFPADRQAACPCAAFVDTRPGVPASERVKIIQSVRQLRFILADADVFAFRFR